MQKNKFIVIEGLEGAGKTHACKCIRNTLQEHNIKNIILVRQPGGTPIAEKIRQLTKKISQEKIVKETELLLMYAARIQLVETIIKPALKNGKWVISDRHSLSSLAYQGGGLGIKKKIILQLHDLFLKNFFPDLTIYLDVTPKIGLKRVANRSLLDQIESRSVNFFKKTRAVYLKNINNNENFIKINANLNIHTVTKKITKELSNWLKKNQ
ncbi:dTMP kinase [Buchnera aphidicola (Hyadaphis tataricae)]|uniref:Thymidylate kinase n=1 Tax=Buchnera aphidicola (Hyadaphis tataricae) TaxID=1241859 RepID=A0A4D6Y5M7_9GAMM|nr:dTMP kinase [Buchnera aphidicola]QCI21648.1 dTMP kinase [Buchnera aphidicola (Hyadaphis tataricae)]